MEIPKNNSWAEHDRIKREKEQKLTEYIKLDLTTFPHGTITCLVCKKSEPVPNKDAWYDRGVFSRGHDGKERYKTLRSNKQLVAWFQEEHYKFCIYPLNKKTRQFNAAPKSSR